MTSGEMTKIKKANFNDVFAILRENGDMSISDISEKTRLSIPTVTKALDYGTSIELVFETEIAPSSGGRKPQLFRINEKYGYTIYFMIEESNLNYDVKDYKDNIVYSSSVKIKLENFLSTADYLIESLLKKDARILGLGFCVPATVNDGVILEWYTNRKFNNYDLKKYFSEKYGVKCVVENDMKTLAHYAVSRNVSKSCAILQVGHNGVGVSLVSNGEVVRGASGFAGEINYLKSFSSNFKNLRYCAKILASIIVFSNPDIVIFYSSKKQIDIDAMLKEATNGLPKYAIPKIEARESYIEDIYLGLGCLAARFKEMEINKQ